MHRFEEIHKVPWRYNKKFLCDIKKNGKKIGKCSEIKFCSSKNVPLKYLQKLKIHSLSQTDWSDLFDIIIYNPRIINIDLQENDLVNSSCKLE